MSSETEFKMNRFDNRVKSFKDWPFDNNLSTCTSSKMALAGFFHTPTETEPDLVKCFVCLKELDGWESEDDPWYVCQLKDINFSLAVLFMSVPLGF